MSITTIFFDLGGVLISNGFDTAQRKEATAHFGLDWEDFEDRHEAVASELERGHLSFDDYLTITMFHDRRSFTREQFTEWLRAQWQAFPDSVAVLEDVSRSKRYFLATLNNESAWIHEARVTRFQLDQYFQVFFTSCYLGLVKPDVKFYQVALKMTCRDPAECVFIDDRPRNLEPARALGMNAIHFTAAPKLREDLAQLGVDIARR
jgi:putative hydrolase of the HAD superfamily